MTYQAHLQTIFNDMRDCAAQMASDRNAFFRKFPFIPPTIGVGDGRAIYVSQKSVVAIREIARVYRENSAEYRRALPQHEMAELVSSAIGLVIRESAADGVKELPIPADPSGANLTFESRLPRTLIQMSNSKAPLES